jgi:hypothetical protein
LATVKKNRGFITRLTTANASGDNHQNNGKSHHSFHLGKKAKAGIGVALIAVILVSAFIFFPKNQQAVGVPGNSTEPVATTNATNKPTNAATPTFTNGPTELPLVPWQPIPDISTAKDKSVELVTNAQNLNSSVWKQVAAYAWNYFQPSVGLDSRTGLPASGDTVGYFTDWDLGVYLQAVMDAQKVNLTGTEGPWGSSARIDKILTFLENRELNSSHYPYWFYQNDGTVNHDLSDQATYAYNAADIGRLLVALNNVKTFNSSFGSRIDNLVYNTYGNRSNFAAIVPSLKTESIYSTSIYSYYCIAGFASFWPSQLKDAPAKIISNIMAAPIVKVIDNITLPNSRLTEDPLLCSIFELTNNPPQLATLANQTYLAQEAFYNKTHTYRAFGEGNTFSGWAYEWIVYDGRPWVITNGDSVQDMNPIVYTKIAFSFLAVYNTTYARNMVMYIEDKMENPTYGYSNGIDELGTVLAATGLHTNGLILSAARYAIQNSP